MNYLLIFLVTWVLAATLTPLVSKLAVRVGAIDQPGGRKIHAKPIARLGGLAIASAFIISLLIFAGINRQLLGLLGGVIVLLAVGVMDDIYDLNAWVKLFWQSVAACVALAGGIGVTSITNPLGGSINLQWGRFAVVAGPVIFHITPVANLLSILWIVGLINAVNFLDGLDGLACGVSGIAAFIIFLLTIGPNVNQPEVAIIAIILAGAALGFLPYNFYPAKIFMGDSGSYFLGITLALLAIYSGAKLATAVLVLGLPIIDSLWTVARRLYHGRSPFSSDRGHLHHLMLDAGLTQRQAVMIYYLVSAVFGLAALVSGSFAKLLAIIMLLVITILLISCLMLISTRRNRSAQV
jgi:UDP-GlcNAc:undecaprenyl-phosphate GlcNAc-1-phosphate transferase